MKFVDRADGFSCTDCSFEEWSRVFEVKENNGEKGGVQVNCARKAEAEGSVQGHGERYLYTMYEIFTIVVEDISASLLPLVRVHVSLCLRYERVNVCNAHERTIWRLRFTIAIGTTGLD